MASNARNFSRSVIAVSATCILGAVVAAPAYATTYAESADESTVMATSAEPTPTESDELSFMTLSTTAVPEEPGNASDDSTADETQTEAAPAETTTSDADATGSDPTATSDTGAKTESGDDTGADAGSDSADGTDDSGAINEAEAEADGSGSSDGTDTSTGDANGVDDSQGGADGEVPVSPESPAEPPVTNPNPDLPVQPVAPDTQNAGPSVVPEEPGKAQAPSRTQRVDNQTSQPTLNESVEPGDQVDEDGVKAETESLAATGANELLIVLGIGALLVVGGVVLVVLRLRKRGS